MKKPLVFLALLLSACGPQLTSEQQDVSAYLKKTLDDPGSYEPASWKPAIIYRQLNADSITGREKGEAAVRTAEAAFDYAKRNGDILEQLTPPISPQLADIIAQNTKISDGYTRASDSLSKLAIKFRASRDTTAIGVLLRHTYRAKNKSGGLVLDSAIFVVFKNGNVRRFAIE